MAKIEVVLKKEDESPSPGAYELLLRSLGVCTAVTLRMYADRKQWNLEDVQVTLEHFKEETGDRIERKLAFTGNLTEEQTARLKEIAAKCPLHKTLSRGVMIIDS